MTKSKKAPALAGLQRHEKPHERSFTRRTLVVRTRIGATLRLTWGLLFRLAGGLHEDRSFTIVGKAGLGPTCFESRKSDGWFSATASSACWRGHRVPWQDYRRKTRL